MAAKSEKLQRYTSVDYEISGNFPLDDAVFESKLFTIFAICFSEDQGKRFFLLEMSCCFERILTLWKNVLIYLSNSITFRDQSHLRE